MSSFTLKWARATAPDHGIIHTLTATQGVRRVGAWTVKKTSRGWRVSTVASPCRTLKAAQAIAEQLAREARAPHHRWMVIHGEGSDRRWVEGDQRTGKPRRFTKAVEELDEVALLDAALSNPATPSASHHVEQWRALGEPEALAAVEAHPPRLLGLLRGARADRARRRMAERNERRRETGRQPILLFEIPASTP